MKLDRRTLKRIRSSTNYIDGVQVLWPPVATHRGEVTMDADGNRYRRCTQCEAWFSRKSKSKCPCNTATYCSRECQKKNWRVHKLHCTRTPVTDPLVPADDRVMMATMNSPEYEEVLKIVGAKFKHDFNQRNTNSSSSSSTNLPPGPEDMSQAMASSQFLFAEDRSHGIVNNTLIFELTDCGYKEVLASEDRHNYYMFLHSQMKDTAKRKAAEQEKTKNDEQRAEAAITST